MHGGRGSIDDATFAYARLSTLGGKGEQGGEGGRCGGVNARAVTRTRGRSVCPKEDGGNVKRCAREEEKEGTREENTRDGGGLVRVTRESCVEARDRFLAIP